MNTHATRTYLGFWKDAKPNGRGIFDFRHVYSFVYKKNDKNKNKINEANFMIVCHISAIVFIHIIMLEYIETKSYVIDTMIH